MPRTISQYREQLSADNDGVDPYADLTDQQFAARLHQRHYSDVPFESFAQRVGLQGPQLQTGETGSYAPAGPRARPQTNRRNNQPLTIDGRTSGAMDAALDIAAPMPADPRIAGAIRSQQAAGGDSKPTQSWGQTLADVPTQVRATAAKTIAGMQLRDLEEFREKATPQERRMGYLDEEVATKRDIIRKANLDLKGTQQGERSLAQKGMQGGATSLLVSLPSLVLGILTRNPALAVGPMMETTGGASYADLRDENIDRDIARKTAAIDEIIEVGTELAPAAVLFKQGTMPAKRLVNFLAREIPGESVATIGQELNNSLARLPQDATAQDVLNGLKAGFEQLPETWAATVAAGGAQAGIVSLAERRGAAEDGRQQDAEIRQPTDEELQATADRFSLPPLEEQRALPPPKVQPDFTVTPEGYVAPAGQQQPALPLKPEPPTGEFEDGPAGIRELTQADISAREQEREAREDMGHGPLRVPRGSSGEGTEAAARAPQRPAWSNEDERTALESARTGRAEPDQVEELRSRGFVGPKGGMLPAGRRRLTEIRREQAIAQAQQEPEAGIEVRQMEPDSAGKPRWRLIFDDNEKEGLIYYNEASAREDAVAARAARGKPPTVLGQPVEQPGDPTEGQAEAGNYKKPLVRWQEMPIRIENLKDSVREGPRDEGGKPAWRARMGAHYGYIQGSKSTDKEGVDIYLGEDAESTRAFVIDQLTPDGKKFDELKVVVGVPDEDAARALYLSNYPRGWKGIGAITEFTPDDLAGLVYSDDAKKAVAWRPMGALPGEPGTTREATDAGISDLESDEAALPESEAQKIQGLGRSRRDRVPAVAGQLSGVPGSRGEATKQGPATGKAGQQQGVRTGQRGLEDSARAKQEQALQPVGRVSGTKDAGRRLGEGTRNELQGTEVPPVRVPMAGGARADGTGEIDARLTQRADQLRHMATRAGWQEVGGQAISVGDATKAEIVGRTKWLPYEDWFPDVQRAAPLTGNKAGKATAEAVRKSLEGEKLSAAERRHVTAMLDRIDRDEQELARLADEGSVEEMSDTELAALEAKINRLYAQPAEGGTTDTEEPMFSRKDITSGDLFSGDVPETPAPKQPAPKAQQTDLFGAPTDIQQLLAKVRAEKERRRNQGQRSVETGRPDDLFSQATQQVDVEDKAREDRPDVRSSRQPAERDRQDTETEVSVEPPAVLPEPAAEAGSARPPGRIAGATRDAAEGRPAVPRDRPVVGGERGNLSFFDGEGRFSDPGSAAGDPDARGSAEGGREAAADDGQREAEAVEAAEAARPRLDHTAKLRAQRQAESIPVELANADNIAATLPYLLPSQHEDVATAERRFSKPDGYGMLFTNSTGTGKTLLGLGIAKRFVKRGKNSGLIVVPSQKLAEDWTRAGKNLGLDLYTLASTEDGGRGLSITTYANFAANRRLADRDYDFVLIDEAHNLMQNEAADMTAALYALRATTNHPAGAYDRAAMVHRTVYDRWQEAQTALAHNQKAIRHHQLQGDRIAANEAQLAQPALQAKQDAATAAWNDVLKRVRSQVDASQGASRSRVMFLSATPFAYEKNVKWGEGYLYEFPELASRGYNTPDGFGQFMMTHFGYRMRTGKLTEPEAEVDRDLMQRSFNSHLRKEGVLAARTLEVDADYDRKFVHVESKIGNKIDEGLTWLRENKRFWPLYEIINKRFDYLARQRLLQALKAQEAVGYIQAQHALGRKVVAFYDYNEGGAINVFDLDTAAYADSTVVVDGEPVAVRKLIEDFREARPDLVSLDTQAANPLVTLKAAFPQAREYNGRIPSRQRTKFVDAFNDDGLPDSNLILAQKAANAGWSAHDTSGKHQRVLINLGLPTAPTVAIQQEGRIFRVGNVSDAVFRYFNTGTSWERIAFAGTIARRAATAENLAMGEQARGLKDAFIQAFEDADAEQPSAGDGKGGKVRDRALVQALSPFDRAVALYFATEKKTSRTKAREGTDYFATPEPLGYMMVQWGRGQPGDSYLEPSAGHGAIARWFPDQSKRHVIEPSFELASRLALATDATLHQTRFEDWNIVNKVDVIVMNPPFGQGGSTAVNHIEKATKHLNDGGRIVALIPEGPAANKKFDKWYEEQDGLYLVRDIGLPAVAFERAGTAVKTRIVILDKLTEKAMKAGGKLDDTKGRVDVSGENIKEFFAAIEDMEAPARAKLPDEQVLEERIAAEVKVIAPATDAPTEGLLRPRQFQHTKTGANMYIAEFTARVDNAAFQKYTQLARKHGGYWNRYVVPGFSFKTPEIRDAFVAGVNGSAAQLRLAPAQGGQPASVVRAEVDRFLGKFQTRPNVIVVQSFAELSDDVQAAVRRAGSPGIEDKVDAFHLSGSVYFIADKIRSVDVVPEKILHEFVTHYGLKAMIPDAAARNEILDGVARDMPMPTRRYGRAYYGKKYDHSNDVQRRRSAEEVIAYYGERYLRGESMPAKLKRWLDRVIKALRDFMRDVLGLGPRFDERFVRVLLQDLQAYLMRGGDTITPVPDASAAASAQAPTFYSALLRAAENVGIAKAPAQQWLNTLRNVPGVKAEEIEWSGLEEWLQSLGRSATKAEVVDFLAANQIEVQDVVRGGESENQFRQERDRVVVELTALGYTPTVYDHQVSMVDRDGREWRYGIVDNEWYVYSGQDPQEDVDNRRLPGEVVGLADQLQQMTDEMADVGGMMGSPDDDETRYRKYTLPGGENYRELLLTLPEKTDPRALDPADIPDEEPDDAYDDVETVSAMHKRLGNYTSTHWSETNILAHVRFNERTDADGKRVLFVEEIQSDWHQAGRKQGYKGDELTTDEKELQRLNGRTWDVDARVSQDEDERRAELQRRVGDSLLAKLSGVPDAPFKTTWPELAFKRTIRWAAENGFQRIAWTTGAIQAERYDLGHVLSSIRYQKEDDKWRVRAFLKEDPQAIANIPEIPPVLTGAQIEEFYGRDIARRITAGEGTPMTGRFRQGFTELKAEGLRVGEGMTGFYDDILPKAVNKLVKRWGGKVSRQEDSAREALPDLRSTEKYASLALDPVNRGMGAAIENDQILSRVVSALPVDVVELLSSNRIRPEDFARDPDVFTNRFTVDVIRTVRLGLRDALTETAARLRTSLDSSYKAGLDKKVLPTLNASGLRSDVAAGILFPETFDVLSSPGSADMNMGTSGARTGTESRSGAVALGGRENLPAGLTDFIRWHQKLRSDNVPSMPDAWKIDVTPEMRDAALEGLPMFSRTDVMERRVPKNSQEATGYAKVANRIIDAWNRKIGHKYGALGNLPEAKKYLIERYKTLGGLTQVREISRGIFESLSAANEADSQRVYAYLTTAGASPDAIEDEKVRTAAIGAKQAIDEQGKALVEAGLLSEESYETYRDQYLPRLYLRHILDDQGRGRMAGSGKKLSDLGYLKKRKDIPEEVRKVILGEITDPAFLAAFGMSRTMRDLTIMNFLQTVSQNKSWVPESMLIDWDGRKVSPFWLQAEAKQLRKQADHIKAVLIAGKARAIADRMDTVANGALERMGGEDLSDFKQIPDSPRYGALRGLYVRKEIHEDLVGAYNFIETDSLLESIFGQGGFLTKATQAWKTSKVAMNVPSHFRNMMGNAIMLHLSGMPMHRVPDQLVKAAISVATKDEWYEIAKKYGLKEATFANTELYRIRDEWTLLQKSKQPTANVLHAMFAKVTNAVGDVYQFEEALFKIAKLRDAMEREGLSEADAMIESHKWIFDYSLVPRWVRYLRNAPFGIPFLSYSYFALPRLAETVVRRPWKFLPYIAVSYAIQQSIMSMFGADDDDLEKLRNAFPEWMQSRGGMMLMPWKDIHGRWQVIDLGYTVPWGQLADMAAQIQEGNYRQSAETMGLFSGPLPDLIAAWQTGIDPFTGREIADKGDPMWKRVQGGLLYAYGMAAPGFLTEKGALGKVIEAHTGHVDPRTGDPTLTKTQAWLRLFGVSVYPTDPEVTRGRNLRHMHFEIEETRKRMGEQLRDRNLSNEQKQEVRDVYIKEIKMRQEALRKYQEESEIPDNLRRTPVDNLTGRVGPLIKGKRKGDAVSALRDAGYPLLAALFEEMPAHPKASVLEALA